MDLYTVRQKLSMGYTLNNIALRVTDYARVSTDHIEQKNSLKNQVDHFEEMIKNNENWTYVPGYIDDGISGTTDYKRNNFMKMINDARMGKFDLIVTKEISRFSRNTLDSIKYTRELLSYGVAVLFVNDNINTALPDSELRLTIMASMAQDEIRRLSERVKFGMNRAIKNGTILGNNLLYGYKKNKITGNLDIIPKQALIVRRLFNMYVIDNLSITKIGKIFNNEGLKTIHNKKWCTATLIRMIKNPKYKGYYCGKKSEIIDYMTKKVKKIPESEWVIYQDKLKIPPIVDENLWQKANIKINKKNKNVFFHNRYPLSSKIFCFFHNEVFHRRKQCKASNDITWICSRYLKNGKKACNSPNIRESEIYFIFNDILDYLKIDLDNVIAILLAMYKNDDNNDLFTKIKKEQKEKEKLLKKKEKLLELNIEGYLSNNEFNIKNEECNKKILMIEDNIKHLQNNYSFVKNNQLAEILKQKIKEKCIKDKIIDLLLNKIIVNKINDNNDNIKLQVFLNMENHKLNLDDFKKNYEFKRGYNTKGTRRYIIKYEVYLFN